MVLEFPTTEAQCRRGHPALLAEYRRLRREGLHVERDGWLDAGPDLKILHEILSLAGAPCFDARLGRGIQLYTALPGAALRCPGELVIRGVVKPCRRRLWTADGPAAVWLRPVTGQFSSPRPGCVQLVCRRCKGRFELDVEPLEELRRIVGATCKPVPYRWERPTAAFIHS